ncbi:sensor histidine kinase [Chitinophaga rhizophila]|uniref:Histidine kinase n=1 Tax=Chitinophaga rhizophila TaxID=2866212 RepID=A0ABS7GKW9_9BACT|nr:sensor histidine kinase [Chitinophaga rhizophila]MBW8688376.1 histidine kinase [Chitinophaga rhizophila]
MKLYLSKYLWTSALLLLLLIAWPCADVRSQGSSYTFAHLDRTDGLASNHVSAVLQDSKGFIWIASTALQRFDGINLVTIASFDKVPGSIYYDDICLCEDNKGRIWMGAPDNIRYYDPTTATVSVLKIDIPPSIHGSISCSRIIQDHAGVIWATTQEGLLKYDDVQNRFIKPANIAENIRRELFSTIIEDGKGNLWISGRGGVYKLDPSRRQMYHAGNNPDNDPLLAIKSSVRRFYIDRQQRIWVAARGGDSLYQYTPDKKELRAFSFSRPQPEGNMVTDIIADRDHHIWIATENGGIFRYNEQEGRFDTNIRSNNEDDQDLHYDFEVNCFLNDRNGRLWVGTDLGVNILSMPEKSFRIMDHRTVFRDTEAHLPRMEVTGLFQDSHGNIYAGYWGRGFCWLSPSLELLGQYLHDAKSPAYQLPEERSLVWSFAEMKDGNVLIGQENGMLSIFDPHKGRFIRHYHPPLFGDQTLMTMSPEGDSAVWIGLYKRGLVKWNTRTDSFIAYPGLLQYVNRPITVMDIARRNDSLLWIATSDAGLLRFNTRTGTVSGAELFSYDKLTVSNITCIEFLDDTTLIAGTDHGLWVYNTEKAFARPLMINGALFDEWVLNLQVNGTAGVWFSTQFGFYRFNRHPGTIETFVQTGDIIDNNRKVRRSVSMLHDGRLMVGASDHFVIFEPSILQVAPPPPDVTILGFRTMDSVINLGIEKGKYAPVTLSHRQNFISIDFKSLLYHHEAVGYLYQMEGVDEEWVKAGGLLTARYTNLPPGSYRFKVRSVDPAGTFSTGITTLTINILPAFWQTAWFRILSVLLIIVLVYVYFRLRVNAVKKEARRRTAIQQQIAQLEMKALRAQMNPHFIFNALNSIQTFMMKRETEQALSYLGRFARLIRNVLDNSQLNSIPISNELRMLENYLELEKLRFGDQFTYDITVDDELDPDFTDIPTMILQPFVENAIWHGLLHKKGEGRLSIAFYQREGSLLCVIEDNGVGREKAAAQRQQGKEHHSRGLQITRDRLSLYNRRFNLDATFDIEDLYDEAGQPCGTRVNVWFPLSEV